MRKISHTALAVAFRGAAAHRARCAYGRPACAGASAPTCTARRSAWPISRAQCAQPGRLFVEALRERQHAEAAEGADGQGAVGSPLVRARRRAT
jgi:hypothetical protein